LSRLRGPKPGFAFWFSACASAGEGAAIHVFGSVTGKFVDARHFGRA
jgi:hypothetical protein